MTLEQIETLARERVELRTLLREWRRFSWNNREAGPLCERMAELAERGLPPEERLPCRNFVAEVVSQASDFMLRAHQDPRLGDDWQRGISAVDLSRWSPAVLARFDNLLRPFEDVVSDTHPVSNPEREHP